MLTILAIAGPGARGQPVLDVDFDALPTGTLRSVEGTLPYRWIVNMESKVFEIATDLPRPPKDRPGLQKALRYRGEGGWPAGDLYIVWPEAARSGRLEARVLVWVPDGRVPLYVALTRIDPTNWQDVGPSAVMLWKDKESCWQVGRSRATCRAGWNHVRVVADLDRRVACAFVRPEGADDEETVAWEEPIEAGETGLSVNALYLRTDLGYSEDRACFADLNVEPCDAPRLAPRDTAADLSHIVPPGEGIDLGGIWDFLPLGEEPKTESATPLPPDGANWLRTPVPAEHDPVFRACGAEAAWFRRSIKLPAAWKGKVISVHFGMTRARADTYWNRQLVHTHWEGYSGYSVDVTRLARPGEENELLVLIHAHRIFQRPDSPLYPLTWDWMYSTGNGICMPVWVESAPPVYVADVFARPSVRDGKLRLDVTVANQAYEVGGGQEPANVQVRAHVLAEGDRMIELAPAEVTVAPGSTALATLTVDWPDARLWWPDDPHLYTAQVELHSAEDGGERAPPLAARRITFGFREFEIRGRDILLNGRRLYLRRQSLLPYMSRVLDRAWFPTYVADLRARGYNCVRIHGGAPELLAREADRLGILIIPEFSIKAPQLDPAAGPEPFLHGIDHCLGIVREQRNHPSILMWNISNEVYIYTVIRAEEQREQLARNLDILGDLVQQADPTRTVGYDGDCDLNGLAPTANLHYPWHVFEVDHPMPTTRFWLEEGREPWMGYTWQKDKPLIIGEFFYAPYEFRAPWGLSQFMGDRAFVHPEGWAEGMFRAYRWADEGYRLARAAGLNPWAVPEPVQDLGVLLPPVLIAVRESNTTFWAGEAVERTAYVFSDVLSDRDYVFRWALSQDGRAIAHATKPLPIEAGGMGELKIALRMPVVRRKQAVELRLELELDGKPACEPKVMQFAVFPPAKAPRRPIAACGRRPALEMMRAAGFEFQRAPGPASALAQQPQAVLLAGVGIKRDEAGALLEWVERGGLVVWLDVPADSWLPGGVQVSGSHYAVYAFRTVGDHAALSDLTDVDLSCWRPDDTVCSATFSKPHLGRALAILEAGGQSGLDWAPLVEVRHGSGCFLLCQMGLDEKVGIEPAATQLLSNLLAYRPEQTAPSGPVFPVAGGHSLSQAIEKLSVEVAATPGEASVLVVDGSSPGAFATDAVRDALARGATVLVRGLVPESAGKLAAQVGVPIAARPATLFHIVRRGRPQLLDGLSNGDFYWSKTELDSAAPVTEGTAPIVEHVLDLPDDPAIEVLTDPPALATIDVGGGRLVLDQIRWAESLEIEPVHTARIGSRLLANLGAEFRPEGPVGKREFAFVDLRRRANRGFQDQVKGDGKGGWTDEGAFDMRYFPVNRTGFDPQGNPMARDPFPPQVHYGGVSFQIINPETNADKSCIVIGRDDPALRPTTGPIEVGRRADFVWLLHAADGYWNDNHAFEIASLRVVYDGGDAVDVPLVNTKQLHDWRVVASLSEGYTGWMGGNGRHSPCVLYVWGWRNPRPGEPIASIELRAGEKYRYMLVAVTCETQ